ncbi:hypothetical protein AKJ16_DCAP03234 [Drosera capensis]
MIAHHISSKGQPHPGQIIQQHGITFIPSIHHSIPRGGDGSSIVPEKRNSAHPRLRRRKRVRGNGVFFYNPNFFGDRDRCITFCQILLQQRTFYESVPCYVDCYGNGVLLDDVGDCVSGTIESSHRTCAKWRVSHCTAS